MELRSSSESSASLRSCLVAARYAGVTVTTVIDDSATELMLRTAKGDIRGRSAVLRCVVLLCKVLLVIVRECSSHPHAPQV